MDNYYTENGWMAEEPDNNGLMCVFHEAGADQMFLTEADLKCMLAMFPKKEAK
jgi:hypothetical protein